MSELVQHNPPNRQPKRLLTLTVMPLERTAEDRDLVRGYTGVAAASSRERNALVEAEQWLPGRRLVLDHDLHVRHERAQVIRQRLQRLLDLTVEANFALIPKLTHT